MSTTDIDNRMHVNDIPIGGLFFDFRGTEYLKTHKGIIGLVSKKFVEIISAEMFKVREEGASVAFMNKTIKEAELNK